MGFPWGYLRLFYVDICYKILTTLLSCIPAIKTLSMQKMIKDLFEYTN
jgi:uncharacterized membrane protein